MILCIVFSHGIVLSSNNLGAFKVAHYSIPMNYLASVIISILTSIFVFQYLWNARTDDIAIDNTSAIQQARLVQKKQVIDLDNFGLKDLENELITTSDLVKDSVVSIAASKDFILYDGRRATWLVEQEIWWWSGIIVSQNWYILTNKHVVEDADASYTIIFSDGERVEADRVRLDANLDIAVLKISADKVGERLVASIIPFGQKVQVGQFALAIWNALAEFQNSVTFGVVSGNNRKLTIDNENIYAWLLQTDTSISEWNSGGPLFNLDGEVIGINTAVSAYGENIWFAIPITHEFVTATLSSIQKYDDLVRPFVWVRYVDLNREIAQELELNRYFGTYIAEIVANSPADQAWLQINDIITHINNVPIDANNTFLYQLFTQSPGDSINVSYSRDDVIYTTDMILSEQ